MTADRLCVGVETEENALVDQGVLLLCVRTLLNLGTSWTDDRLDLRAVNDAGYIWVRNLGGGQPAQQGPSARCTVAMRYGHIQVVLLVYRCLVKGAEDLIEEGEGAFGVNDEATDVAAGSELEKV